MACNAPKKTDVPARTPTLLRFSGTPRFVSPPSQKGIRKPRKKASSPTPAPRLSATTPGRPSGARLGKTPTLKMSRTSPRNSNLSACVMANASDASRGTVHSDAVSRLSARVPSRTSGWTPRNDDATWDPTPISA